VRRAGSCCCGGCGVAVVVPGVVDAVVVTVVVAGRFCRTAPLVGWAPPDGVDAAGAVAPGAGVPGG
jgi:hypothetical protein